MTYPLPRGAHVTYTLCNDERATPLEYQGYVSFGRFLEDLNEDEFGIPDERILYYFWDGHLGLDRYIARPDNDFVILDYDLVFECPVLTPHMVEWADIKADCQYDHDNEGYIFGIHWEDSEGQVADAQWYQTEAARQEDFR
jgi:hypothetical protein